MGPLRPANEWQRGLAALHCLEGRILETRHVTLAGVSDTEDR
jgi:hypothetical protein